MLVIYTYNNKNNNIYDFERNLDLVALDYLFFKKDAFAIISAKYEGLRSEK